MKNRNNRKKRGERERGKISLGCNVNEIAKASVKKEAKENF